ncbi:CubicO group peptidase, beta-lactamase class C family [Friedmanniella luteola]|uniref:CubicO group peptidase, beta-lactamase class C family n=1 Tax=Friedmanniella luteola TaxID=546871 RepID=A0A1H1TSJ5_9ACTN|nr:serine hydrolase [Friedmanniella luteola]SDS62896.1 CubicO group peptidase, beta-lactamase class C family [Friedmanniella luteola]
MSREDGRDLTTAELEQQVRDAGLLSGDVAVAVACTAPGTGRLTSSSGTLADRAVDAGTPLYVASVTKQLVGVLAAQQVLAGRLDPEASVTALDPRLPGWAAPVRVRHLLHHTAGLPSTAVLLTAAGVAEPELTNERVVAALAALPGPGRPPGEAFAYSNLGYVVLAEVLAAVTGTALPVLARQQVFEPLGLVSAHLGAAPPGRPADLPAAVRPPATVGDGGWWIGAAELLTWLDALNRGALGAGVSELVQTPGRLDDGTPLTYGWGVTVRVDADGATCTHGGTWPGWTAKTVRRPATGTAVALLTTGGDVDAVSGSAVALHDQLVAGPSSQSSSRASSSRRPSAS